MIIFCSGERPEIASPEYEGFVKDGVEVFSVDLGLEFLLAVGEEVDFYVGVAAAGYVFDGEISSL